jgi:hypothetical protein
MMKSPLVISAVVSFMSLLGAGGAYCAPPANPSIVRDGEAIRITAGVLERVIRVSGGNIATERLTVAGMPLIDGRADELSLRLAKAEPNQNPLESSPVSTTAAVSVSETKVGGTDALDVTATADPGTQQAGKQVAWADARSFRAGSWGACFDLANATITVPQPGT